MNMKKFYEFPQVSVRLVKETNIPRKTYQLNQPYEVAEVATALLEDRPNECFCVLALDVKNRPVAFSIVSEGLISFAPVHSRNVFQVALLSNANSIILIHNHMSDCSASKEDIEITKRFAEIGKLMQIPLLDHIIVAPDGFLSLKAEGYVD